MAPRSDRLTCLVCKADGVGSASVRYVWDPQAHDDAARLPHIRRVVLRTQRGATRRVALTVGGQEVWVRRRHTREDAVIDLDLPGYRLWWHRLELHVEGDATSGWAASIEYDDADSRPLDESHAYGGVMPRVPCVFYKGMCGTQSPFRKFVDGDDGAGWLQPVWTLC